VTPPGVVANSAVPDAAMNDDQDDDGDDPDTRKPQRVQDAEVTRDDDYDSDGEGKKRYHPTSESSV